MMVSGVNGVLAWPDHATMTTFIVSSIAGPELFSGGEKYRTALKLSKRRRGPATKTCDDPPASNFSECSERFSLSKKQ